MCSNITIINDNLIELDENFTVSIMLESTNFSAGVTLTPDSATVVIVDGDGEYSRVRRDVLLMPSWLLLIKNATGGHLQQNPFIIAST